VFGIMGIVKAIKIKTGVGIIILNVVAIILGLAPVILKLIA
jgi:hypothetical protein